MRISRERIREVATAFLSVLDGEEVRDLGSLEKLAGQAIPVKGKEQDYVVVSYRPSNYGTRALSVEYAVMHKPNGTSEGVPLNIRVNRELKQTSIIVKCSYSIEGYNPFALDPFNNRAQFRRLDTTDWVEVKKEIDKLKS